MSPGDRDSKGHRGNNSTGNRGKGDWGKDGGKDHQRLEIRREERKIPDNRSSRNNGAIGRVRLEMSRLRPLKILG